MTITNVNFRTAVPEQDYEALAALLCKIWHEPTTPTNIHDWDRIGESDGDGRVLIRTLLEDDQGTLLGYGTIRHQVYEKAGWFYLWVGIDPAQRQQGLGQHLYQHMLELAIQHGATELGSDVLDDCAECLQFAEKQGFNFASHLYESTIECATFDATPFAGLIEEVKASGIRFTSLAAEGDTPETRRKLYDLNAQAAHDDPASHGHFPSFAAFNHNWDNASWFVPEGQLLAVDGERYVGLAAVGYFKETNSMYNLMTGVDKAYRGRKIAQALKLKSIKFAQAYGADYIRTHNDSENGPMLAINRKLGYQPKPGEYRLIKKLQESKLPN